MIRIVMLLAIALACLIGAPACGVGTPAIAEEGNRQRPPLAAGSGDCHIVDTQPLFSEAIVGKSYKRTKASSLPLTWTESFRTARPAAEVTIAHRGCEDISSTIRLHFDGEPLARSELLQKTIDLLGSLDPQPDEGPVPFNLKQIVAWLDGEEAGDAQRIDHTVCFHRVADECIEDAYFIAPQPNVLVITSVDRP